MQQVAASPRRVVADVHLLDPRTDAAPEGDVYAIEADRAADLGLYLATEPVVVALEIAVQVGGDHHRGAPAQGDDHERDDEPLAQVWSSASCAGERNTCGGERVSPPHGWSLLAFDLDATVGLATFLR